MRVLGRAATVVILGAALTSGVAVASLARPQARTPGPPPSKQALFASDSFARTVSNGFGQAPVGGLWTVTGNAGDYSVTSGAAELRITAAGGQLAAYLPSAAVTEADVRATVSVDKRPTGNGLFLSVTARRVGANEYQGKARLTSTGQVVLSLSKLARGVQSALRGEVAIPGLLFAPGVPLAIRVQASGAGVTTVQAKVWRAGAAEPTAWAVTATDTDVALQSSGGIGLVAYLSGRSTNAPVTVKLMSLTGAPTSR